MIDKNTSIGLFSFNRLNKNHLVNAAKIIIAGGLIYYLINVVDYNKIILAIKDVNLLIVLIVFLLGILNVYLQYSSGD